MQMLTRVGVRTELLDLPVPRVPVEGEPVG